jgi:tetratricopeptide (TPR) repeat protein
VENHAKTTDGVLTIALDGPFRAILPSGKIITLSSVKAQGCLALLCTTKDYRHTRAWLADKLWSDKDTEHARGSLRHALAEIRQTICTNVDILGSDRRSVWLHADRIRLVRDFSAEFLEGIDIRDPEWEDWLRDQRMRAGPGNLGAQDAAPTFNQVTSAESSSRGLNALSIGVDRTANSDDRFMGAVVSDTLARNILETTGIEVRLFQEAEAGILLSVSPHQKPKPGGIQLSLRQVKSGRYIWSSGRKFAGPSFPALDDIDFMSLLVEAQDAAIAGYLSHLHRLSAKPDVVEQTQLAARKIFTYDAPQLFEAEKTLEEISSAAPSAVSIAWLLVLNRVMIFERVATVTKERLAGLEMRCAQAVTLGPTNAFVLAAVSSVYLRFLGRPDEGFALARRAVRLNPSSPYALDALAGALYLCGKYEEGYRVSRRVRALTANTENAHFFEMSLCLASILTGRNDEALNLASSASALAPKFRAAWRYSLALHANERDFPRAVVASRWLRSIEPDFSVDRLVNDVDYPIASLRNSSVNLDNLQEILAD